MRTLSLAALSASFSRHLNLGTLTALLPEVLHGPLDPGHCIAHHCFQITQLAQARLVGISAHSGCAGSLTPFAAKLTFRCDLLEQIVGNETVSTSKCLLKKQLLHGCLVLQHAARSHEISYFTVMGTIALAAVLKGASSPVMVLCS